MTKKILINLLLAFVLLSIGFAVGKEVTLRRLARSSSPATAPAAGKDKLIVYYAHSTMRCKTCNAMEKMAREVLDTDFAPQLLQGQIEWRTADFQSNEALAKKYDINASTIVLVKVENGQERSFKRLDEIWGLWQTPDAFKDHIRGCIRASTPAATVGPAGGRS